MRVSLGKFTSWAVQARFGGDPEAFVQTALLHYTRRLKSKMPPVGVPRLRSEPADADAAITLELAVGPEVLTVLEQQADAYRVPVETVVEHAVYVYLVDLDSASEQSADLDSPTEEPADLDSPTEEPADVDSAADGLNSTPGVPRMPGV
jgi:hypothetical protein